MGITLTEAAATEIRRVIDEQNRPELKYVRVGVVGGGCSGFQYSFNFTNEFDETADMMSEHHGVGVVESIGDDSIDGIEQTYYFLRLLANDSKVMVPEENLDLVGLRPLCKQKDIKSLFGLLEDGEIDTYKDWKGRYKQNLDKMKTGDLTEVADVLKNLRLVSEKKSLSFREKKMFEKAKYFIVSEVAHVKKITEETAEKQVEKALNTSLAKRKKKKGEEDD